MRNQYVNDMRNFCAIAMVSIVMISCNSAESVKESDRSELETVKEETIFAGGIELRVSETGDGYIRVYTDTALSRIRQKAVISDLTGEYGDIYFGTEAKHETGEDYASWTGGRYFDYEKEEILSKTQFFKSEKKESEKSKTKIGKRKKKTEKPPVKHRDHLMEPRFEEEPPVKHRDHLRIPVEE